jgi:hypothetical protein
VHSRDFLLNLHHNRLQCSALAHLSAPCFVVCVVRPLRPTGGVLHISVECQTGIQTILEDF